MDITIKILYLFSEDIIFTKPNVRLDLRLFSVKTA